MEKGGLVKDTRSSHLTPDPGKCWKLPKLTGSITSIPKEPRANFCWELGLGGLLFQTRWCGCPQERGGLSFWTFLGTSSSRSASQIWEVDASGAFPPSPACGGCVGGSRCGFRRLRVTAPQCVGVARGNLWQLEVLQWLPGLGSHCLLGLHCGCSLLPPTLGHSCWTHYLVLEGHLTSSREASSGTSPAGSVTSRPLQAGPLFPGPRATASALPGPGWNLLESWDSPPHLLTCTATLPVAECCVP